MQKETFQLLAQYNRWMNARLFAACAKLDDEQLTADRGAFFGSVMTTLNHLMVADIIWLKRFTLGSADFASLANVQVMPIPGALDAILYPSLPALSTARQDLDSDIIDFCNEVTADQLTDSLSYRNFVGDSFEDPLGVLIQHLFNHQTHHRGQITTLLSQSGIDVGATDLMVCVRELEAANKTLASD